MSSSPSENAVDVARNFQAIREKIQQANPAVRLVAVSKTKPVSLLQEAYDAGCRVFGENYAQELVEKVPQLPDDVHWHFIGGLQSNKANMLVGAFSGTNLARLTVETVDKFKLASKLDKAAGETKERLKIFVQVNTSGEDTKSGCEPSEVVEICRQITENCPNLQLQGLMTIGAPGDTSCFDTLVHCREQVQNALGRDDLELSMGMSDDFLEAIAKGSTNVRVGSTIFGARNYADKK